MAASLQVDRAQSNAMNLQVLKRQDDAVMDIVDTASHVVMYEFDQDGQSWKRKEVEGCLFVVKRFSAPRFQICITNRLSTTNMTLAVDERLEVDSVDSFLILRSPDPAYATGYAIYGAWFFPEEDREKIRSLLTRVIQSSKDAPQAPVAAVNSAQPTQLSTQQTQPPQPQQVQQQQTQPQQAQQQTPKSRSRSRSRNKRQQATAATPTKILQRSPKNSNSSASSSNGGAAAKPPVAPQDTGMVPISRADGIAAGEAILGMISQKPASESSQQQQHGALLMPTAVAASGKAVAPSVNKEQLKQTLISLLDDAQFFDQIYHAYVDRVHQRA